MVGVIVALIGSCIAIMFLFRIDLHELLVGVFWGSLVLLIGALVTVCVYGDREAWIAGLVLLGLASALSVSHDRLESYLSQHQARNEEA